MKQYFENLWLALTGRNPFQKELEQAWKDYEQVAAKVNDLRDLYSELSGKMGVYESQIKDYQTLVENLRRRLNDKDDVIKALQSAINPTPSPSPERGGENQGEKPADKD